MKIKKIFLTVYDEKKWLEQKAEEGYILKRRKGVTYELEKTDGKVFYRYIFLKKGRKSFLELDHKNRDPKCRFIYGNGFVALFCREDGYPELMSGNELKQNYIKHRQTRQTLCICCAAACCTSALRYRFILAALFGVLAVYYWLDVKKLDKMTEEL